MSSHNAPPLMVRRTWTEGAEVRALVDREASTAMAIRGSVESVQNRVIAPLSGTVYP